MSSSSQNSTVTFTLSTDLNNDGLTALGEISDVYMATFKDDEIRKELNFPKKPLSCAIPKEVNANVRRIFTMDPRSRRLERKENVEYDLKKCWGRAEVTTYGSPVPIVYEVSLGGHKIYLQNFNGVKRDGRLECIGTANNKSGRTFELKRQYVEEALSGIDGPIIVLAILCAAEAYDMQKSF